MQRPTSGADATPVRVVVVTLNNHIAGALARARQELRAELPGLEVSLHAAATFGDPRALEACRADIARADIIFANMLFIEEHIRAILPALQARRDACDALVCCMSAGEVMRETRMGTFRMDGSQKGPLALLKKLRGKTNESSKDGGAGQLAMLRRLPKVLKFIPGKAQELRTYFLALSYWLSGSSENIADSDPPSREPLCGRPAQGAARHADREASARIPRHRPLPPRAGRADHRVSRRPAPTAAVQGNGRPARSALLRALRRLGSLRRCDRRAGSARPAGHPGLRLRARLTARHREVLHEGRQDDGRRRRFAHGLLPRGRARVHRREGGRGDPGRARRAVRGRSAPRVPEHRRVEGLVRWSAAARGHHHGGDP